jgi:ribulose-phosphate 3-epimerase
MKIYPSLMAKNQKELNLLFKKLDGVSKEFHLDVGDGVFVPSKVFQFDFKLLRKYKYNVHLMVKNPKRWIQKYGRRFEKIYVHHEVIDDSFAMWMKEQKKKVCIAVKPETKVSEIDLKYVDYVLVLTVHPGFYGGKYLKAPLKKIAQIKRKNSKIKVLVDGGMNPSTIKDAVKAGADAVVSGSFISKAENSKKAMRELRDCLK